MLLGFEIGNAISGWRREPDMTRIAGPNRLRRSIPEIRAGTGSPPGLCSPRPRLPSASRIP